MLSRLSLSLLYLSIVVEALSQHNLGLGFDEVCFPDSCFTVGCNSNVTC